MEGVHGRMFQISNMIRGDVEAGQLMEDVLNNCFEYVIRAERCEQGNPGSGREILPVLSAALQRFNHHLAGYDNAPDGGLFSGGPEEIAFWAEELTFQIWANRPS